MTCILAKIGLVKQSMVFLRVVVLHRFYCTSVSEDCFSGNSVDHVDMPPCSSGSSMLAKIPVYQRAAQSFHITLFKITQATMAHLGNLQCVVSMRQKMLPVRCNKIPQ